MSAAREVVVGVDGARAGKRLGWIAARLVDGACETIEFHDSFVELLAANDDAVAIGVDIPIGLARRGGRRADELARRRIGPRGSSVFPAPVRSVLGASSYEEACALSLRDCGKKLSKQAWMLVPRIREVDAHRDDPRLWEVHPEVSFRELAGEPLAFNKKVWSGVELRRRLLEEAGIRPPLVGAPAGSVAPDDVLDAAAVAWSARRIARGNARSLPESPAERDGDRALAIWA